MLHLVGDLFELYDDARNAPAISLVTELVMFTYMFQHGRKTPDYRNAKGRQFSFM